MEIGLKAKFEQNPIINKFLIKSGTSMLVEANPTDFYWGLALHCTTGELGQRILGQGRLQIIWVDLYQNYEQSVNVQKQIS